MTLKRGHQMMNSNVERKKLSSEIIKNRIYWIWIKAKRMNQQQ